jgi:hypothetical protein
MVARGAGGGWGGVGEDLSLNMYFFTDRPAQTILLNPFHYTATKSPFTLLEITMGQDKIYGWSAQVERSISISGVERNISIPGVEKSTFIPGV